MEINKLIKEFLEIFGQPDKMPSVYFSPGRVNLIGEHTDYNGGYVLPCAISYGTWLAIRKSDHIRHRFVSANFEGRFESEPGNIRHTGNNDWVNYPLGVINEFQKMEIEIPSMDFYFYGNIPSGAGLSSSAAIEVVTAFALDHVYGTGLTGIELALAGQKAENEFVGMNCGIMDQFASAFGKKNSALFLNCETLQHKQVSLPFRDHHLVIVNSRKERKLTESAYNQRRMECERAVEYISRERPVNNLSELSAEDFNTLKHLIKDETVKKRAAHVISENNRVLRAVQALYNNDHQLFGKLMNESHQSMKNDFEVTGHEMDTLAEEGSKLKGVAGARMTGGGFGGCTVNFVHKEHVREFCTVLAGIYTGKTGLIAEFYIPEIGDGAKQIC